MYSHSLRPSVLFLVSAVLAFVAVPLAQKSTPMTGQVPTFRVDPFWPKPLPNRWIIGAVAGVAVDQARSRLDRSSPVHVAAE